MHNLLLFAVGEEYVNLLIDYKKYIPSNFNVNVFTSDVNKVKENLPTSNVKEYKSNVFKYFDKFKYSVDLSNKLKKSVLYVDVGRLCETSEDIWNLDLEQVENICFTATWGELKTANDLYELKTDLFEDNYWKGLLDNFKINLDLNKIPLFLERVFIIPFKQSMNTILVELENIRKEFENLSITKQNVYSGIGNGEGLGMGYVITKLNEPYDFVEKYINKKVI